MIFYVRFKTEKEYRLMKALINLAIFDYSALVQIATNPWAAKFMVKAPYDFFRVWRNYEDNFSVIKIDNDYLSIGSAFKIRVDGII